MEKFDYLKVPTMQDALGRVAAKTENRHSTKHEVPSKTPVKQEPLGKVAPKHDILGKRPDVKILFLGARNVGKTALIVRFVTKRYIGEYDKTKDASYTKQIKINAQDVTIEMLDPQSMESKKNIRSKIDICDAIVLVYSITNKRSFEEAKNIKETIDITCPYRPKALVLIANKTDMRNSRHVASSEGQMLARQWGCSYFECSAAVYSSGYEVICEAIVELCQEVIRINELQRNAGRIGRRRASLSPRLFRDTIFKMLGTTKDDFFACRQSDL